MMHGFNEAENSGEIDQLGQHVFHKDFLKTPMTYLLDSPLCYFMPLQNLRERS